MTAELSSRAREILRQIVDSYVATGEAVGSRTIAKRSGLNLSPASIRKVMAELEEAGLLFAPHTSAGRLPTETGLRLYVDGMLQIGGLSESERESIESRCIAHGRSMPDMLAEVGGALSGLSRCAGLVVAPKTEGALRQIEFVGIAPGRVLAVMVGESGMVENRLLDVPLNVTPSSLQQASNYLNSRLAGRSLGEARAGIMAEIESHRSALDELSAKIAAAGLSAAPADQPGALIIKGQATLLDDVTAIEDLHRLRELFTALEARESALKLVETTSSADGVQIFIGSENHMFNHTGCSLVIAPYRDSRRQIIGAIGVIGPIRLNYAKIIPMVDYTARLIGSKLG